MEFLTPKRATIIAALTSGFLVVIKFIVAFSSGSIVVLASAIDSLLDICMSLFNYFALKNAEKPANQNFNYGFGKLLYIAALLEGIVILGSAVYIFYQSLWNLSHQESLSYTDMAIFVMVLSIVMVGALVWVLGKVAKSSGNAVIAADMLHYKSDLFSNGAILLSLLVMSFWGFYLLDPILGILISIYIAYGALRIIKNGALMLLDRALPPVMQVQITDILHASQIVGFYNLKTRIVGDRAFVVVYIIFEEGITLCTAHSISDQIEAQIKALERSREWEIIIHLEPIEHFANYPFSFTKRKDT
ncbi:hypothetical protein BKH46_07080 [Helicobacter sp. 12S02634-8]|nr:hypothetical protein BKH46_07080 [Helicobacter sp. 12S02634-8]